MNFPWNNVFEHFKERRHAALFVLALGAFSVVLIMGAILYEIVAWYDLLQFWRSYWPAVLAGAVPAWSFMIWRGVRRMRMRRGRRYEILPLSRDEMSKARSKLLKAKP